MLTHATSKMGVMYHEWEEKQFKEDEMALQQILMTKPGRDAYAKRYNLKDSEDIRVPNNYQRNYALLSKALYSDPEMEEKRLKQNFNFNNFFGSISKMFK